MLASSSYLYHGKQHRLSALANGHKKHKGTNNKAAKRVVLAEKPMNEIDICNADAEKPYTVKEGLILNSRYWIHQKLGEGGHGAVYLATDMQNHHDVAIKIATRATAKAYSQAQKEIDLLLHLNEKAKTRKNKGNIVRLLNHFEHQGHQCLVFEKLSVNLYAANRGGFSLRRTRKIACQLLTSLAFLEQADVIHGDIKPENILLKRPGKGKIKLVDFGLSCRSKKLRYKRIGTPEYLSPEMFLCLPYSFENDMWSLGCVLAEFHTGDTLFPSEGELQHLQMMEALLGKIPDSLLSQVCEPTLEQFIEQHVDCDTGRIEYKLHRTKPSSNPIASLTQAIQSDFPRPHDTPEEYELFLDLLHKMLTYEPSKRIRPLEALKHPFILGVGEDSES